VTVRRNPKSPARCGECRGSRKRVWQVRLSVGHLSVDIEVLRPRNSLRAFTCRAHAGIQNYDVAVPNMFR